MQENDPRQLIENYLEAFKARNLDRCLSFFDDEAELEWMMGSYRGRDSIEEWHKDRFGADLKIVRVEGINVRDEVATADVVVNSKRLAAWRLFSLGGRVTAEFRNGKIYRTKFAAKSINPQQGWS